MELLAESPTPTGMLACENNKSHAISFTMSESRKKCQTISRSMAQARRARRVQPRQLSSQPPRRSAIAIVPHPRAITIPRTQKLFRNARMVKSSSAAPTPSTLTSIIIKPLISGQFGLRASRSHAVTDGLCRIALEVDSPSTESTRLYQRFSELMQGSATVLPTVEATPSVSYDGDSASSPKKK